MKKGMKILFTVVMFTTLISFGKEAEKREEQPQLTVEMLMAALDVSYRCYDIEDVVGSEKSLYLEVVTKDGVILSRLITMLKQLQPRMKYLGLFMRREEDKLCFSCLFLVGDKTSLASGALHFKIDDYMHDMMTSSPNFGVYKLDEFFSFGTPVKVGNGITLNPDKMNKLSGEIGYRIVAK